jgi:signal transduction histidine kinase
VRLISSALRLRLTLGGWAIALLLTPIGQLALIDHPFQGFWANQDGSIGATDLVDWTGPRAGLRPSDRIATVNGVPFKDCGGLLHAVAPFPLGTPMHYGLADGRTLAVPTMRFTWWDGIRVGLTWWLAALVHLLLGAWVLARRPDSAAAVAHWRFCQVFALFLLGGLAGTVSPIFFVLNYVGGALMLPAIIELVLVFPVRLAAPVLERQIILLGRMGGAFLVILVILGVCYRDWFPLTFALGVGVPSFALLAALGVWARVAFSPAFERNERAQTQLVFAGLAVSFAPSVLFSFAAMMKHPLPGFEFAFMGFCAFPAAIATAIAKHRTFEIERLVRRATLYSLLSAALLGLYAVCVAVGHVVLGGWTAKSQGESLLGFGTALLLALALRPLHDWLRRSVDKRFFGQRADPLRSAADLGHRAATAEIEALAQDLARSIRDALSVRWAALCAEGELLALAGDRRLDEVPALIVDVPGARAHQLWLGPRIDEMAFTREDQALLGVLAVQTGLGLTRAMLYEERVRLEVREAAAATQAAAREAIFQQVVHDLGTDLSNIVVAADLARQLPGETGPLRSIEESVTRITNILAEKRAQLHADLPQPATTLAAGVALASEALARQIASRAQHLATALPDNPICVPLSEVELGQVLVNVLANAVRMSPAHARIGLDAEQDAEWVCLRVCDAGPGIPADLLDSLGSGLRANAEGRGLGLANALSLVRGAGGTLTWRNGATGAIVEITLPIVRQPHGSFSV